MKAEPAPRGRSVLIVEDDPRTRDALVGVLTLLGFGSVPVASFVDPEIVERLERKMARTGYLPSESMATTFDLLRANDLIFNYVVSNLLMAPAMRRNWRQRGRWGRSCFCKSRSIWMRC